MANDYGWGIPIESLTALEEERKRLAEQTARQNKSANTAAYYASLNRLAPAERAAAMGVPYMPKPATQSPYSTNEQQQSVIASMPKKTSEQLAAERAAIMSLGESKTSAQLGAEPQPQAISGSDYLRDMRIGQRPAAMTPSIRSSTTPSGAPVNTEFNPFTRKYVASNADAQTEKASGYQKELDRISKMHGLEAVRERAGTKDNSLFGVSKKDRAAILMAREETAQRRDEAQARIALAERGAASEERKVAMQEQTAQGQLEVQKKNIDFLENQAKAQDVRAARDADLTEKKLQLEQMQSNERTAEWKREYMMRSDEFVNKTANYQAMEQKALVRDWVGESVARRKAWSDEIKNFQNSEQSKTMSAIISNAVDKGFDSYKRQAQQIGVDIPFTKQQFDVASPEVKRQLKKSLFSAVVTRGALERLQANAAQLDAIDVAERGGIGDIADLMFPKPK